MACNCYWKSPLSSSTSAKPSPAMAFSRSACAEPGRRSAQAVKTAKTATASGVAKTIRQRTTGPAIIGAIRILARRSETAAIISFVFAGVWKSVELCPPMSAIRQPFGSHLAHYSTSVVVYCFARHSQTVPCVARIFFMLFAFGNCHVLCPPVLLPRCVLWMHLLCWLVCSELDHLSNESALRRVTESVYTRVAGTRSAKSTIAVRSIRSTVGGTLTTAGSPTDLMLPK
jgi:hypothetical protein